MGLRPRPLVWMRTHYLLQKIRTGRNVVRVHPFELLGSSERKWGVAGVWKIYPVELQDRARLHFTSTYYHVESVLQKILKRQDHPLLIVSISIYNRCQSQFSVFTTRISNTISIYLTTTAVVTTNNLDKDLLKYCQIWTILHVDCLIIYMLQCIAYSLLFLN